MIKRIGILTFHASHNYGSMLQTYALQTALERMGCSVTIINLRNLASRFFYIRPGKLLTKHSLKEIVAHPVVFTQKLKKWKRFEQFIRDFYHISREHTNIVDTEIIINNELALDAVITGGDQIWNMDCVDYSPAYFLPFDTPGIRRISYSPSLGDEKWWKPSHYSQVLKALVSRYDFPSVREKSAAVFLSELTGSHVPYVPDPTILLDKKDYETLAGERPLVKGEYVFYYSPFRDQSISGFVARFAKYNGYKVVSSNKALVNEEREFVSYSSAGPVEFLNLLKNATVVCGRSFHLVIFSLILRKQFFALDHSEGARIMSLLKEVGLTSRYVMVDFDPAKCHVAPIEWEKVSEKIARLRQNGYDFLQKALTEVL